MADFTPPVLIGQSALSARFKLRRPPPAVTSVVAPGVRKTVVEQGYTTERYPASYQPEDTLAGQLKFALRYEPTDLGILAGVFAACDPTELESWVRAEPTGAYARRAWFLYEWLTGRRLDLPDAPGLTYVDALDPALHVVAKGIPSKRHKVTNNLPGSPGFCPTVRRTEKLEHYLRSAIDAEARQLLAGCDPQVLARAVHYLYTKETRSSYRIENETATRQKAERFVAALRSTQSFDPTSMNELVLLQNEIVDPRYAARGLRDFQNFVGESQRYRERVHFICPRPEDVAALLHDWAAMTSRLRNGVIPPVVGAALISFGFVFIHPFEDGNGRIHRYLIHHVLATEGFSPPGVLFPVSAAIVRDLVGYDRALETFSTVIQPHIDWDWTSGSAEKELKVENETAALYRYFDATGLVEFLYEKVIETVRKDLREELEFVAVHDDVLRVVTEIVDMPDRRAGLLVQLLLQNEGKLSKSKRETFAELTDAELLAMETAVQRVIAGRERVTGDGA